MARRIVRRFRIEPLQNGLDYMESVVENLTGTPSDRRLKYAVLHLAAAIEVLAKARLAREHWALILSKLDGASESKFASGDFQSVSAPEALRRLRDIAGLDVSDDDVQKVRTVIEMRNRLQHHGLTESRQAIQSSAARALDFLLTFVDREFRVDGELDEDVNLGLMSIRSDLAGIKKLVTTRLQSISGALDEAPVIVQCPTCGQLALEPGEVCRCHYCTEEADPEDAARRYVEEVLGQSEYAAAKMREEWTLFTCPTCEAEALVGGAVTRWEPDDMHSAPLYWVCFADGWTGARYDLSLCMRCGQPTGEALDSGPVCSSCIESVWLEEGGVD